MGTVLVKKSGIAGWQKHKLIRHSHFTGSAQSCTVLHGVFIFLASTPTCKPEKIFYTKIKSSISLEHSIFLTKKTFIITKYI